MVHIHVRHPFWAFMRAIVLSCTIVNVSIDGDETPKDTDDRSNAGIDLLSRRSIKQLWRKRLQRGHPHTHHQKGT